MIHEFTDEFWRCWLLLLLTFSLLWFLLSLVLVWPNGHGCGSRFAASAPPAVLILIRPLLRGKRREIINFNLTNLSFSVDTFEVQRRYFSLVQWSKTANMSKTSNNNLFFNSSLTPENIHVFIKHPYLHWVQTSDSIYTCYSKNRQNVKRHIIDDIPRFISEEDSMVYSFRWFYG